MKFSIGYNYDSKVLNLLKTYRDNIEAFYFPIPQMYLGSGRHIKEPKSYINQIPLIIKKCDSLDITSQLLLNATYEGESSLSKKFFDNVLNYIKRLRDARLKSVVVTNPIYISRIKKEISDIKIESSVNCYVRTVEHALYLKQLGVDVLTIDRDINRNIPLIKEIKSKTSLKLRIMLNEGCLSNCPYRVCHYNYLLAGFNFSASRIEGVFWDKFCIEIYQRDPLKVFRIPFIPPEAVSYYEQLVDYYKLSTRVFTTDRIELCLKAYIDKHSSSNLLTLLDCPGLSYFEYIDYGILKKNNYFEKMLTCSLRCHRCSYCNVLFKKAVLINRNYQDKRDEAEERKSIKLYKKGLKRFCNEDKKIQSYIRIADAYLRLNRYKEAIRSIRRALKLNYKGSDIYSVLGFCYEGEKNYKRAIKALRKAEKINPKDIRVNLALARCYKRLGKTRLLNKEIDKIAIEAKFNKGHVISKV